MAITLKHIIAACAVALAAACLCASAPALAQDVHTTHPKATAVLKAKEKAKGKKKAAKKEEPAEVVDTDPEPDVTDTVVTHYSCELNNKVDIYVNDNDPDHIALRWKNRLHRLDRSATTTGARRFENPKFGIIWIGIPAKGILLDSKLNRQLANECKTDEQAKPLVAAMPAEKKG